MPNENYYYATGTEVTSIADAIRAKTGTSEQLAFPEGFVDAIDGMHTSVPSINDDVIYIDYDGTVVYSYTKEDFAGLTEHPSNPTHTGLTAQGWNWTLSDAQTYVGKYGKLVIGQSYITTSGKTEIDVDINNTVALSPIMQISVNGTITIDWGDGSTADEITKSTYYTVFQSHTYTSTGKYTITIDASENSTYKFYDASSSNASILYVAADNKYPRTMSYCIENIRLGNGIEMEGYDFKNTGIKTITIPKNITQIGTYAFYQCPYLQAVVIPSTVTSIGNSAFYRTYSLKLCSIPKQTTSLGTYVFFNSGIERISFPELTTISQYFLKNAYNLNEITIPSTVTLIDTNAFAVCYSLKKVHIYSSNIEFINGYEFSNDTYLQEVIFEGEVAFSGNSTFAYCENLNKIVFKDDYTISGTGVFYNNYSLKEFILPNDMTTVPSDLFYYCQSLQYINIPNTVTVIKSAAFRYAQSINKFVVPSSVTQIESSAFNNTKALAYYFLSETPPTLDNGNAFYGIYSSAVFYVPYSADHSILNAYQTATNWSSYSSKFVEMPAS
jgi:hypothetical protein